MAQGCVVFDAGLHLVAFNDQYEKMFDYPPHTLRPGMSLEEVVSLRGAGWGGGTMRSRAENIRRHIERANDSAERTRERRLSNGTVYIYHRKPLPDGGFITTYTDITERKAMEDNIRASLKAAEMASQSKSEFLANMSHELRTPLNAIIGFSEIIRGGRFGPIGNKRYEEYLDDIYKSGQHLLVLISDILDLSKGEAGKIELFEEVFDPAAVLGECLRMVKVGAADKGIDLTADFIRGESALHGDRKLFKQIVINLLSNAIKFTAPGGKIRISGLVEPMSGYALSVRDNGIGMAPEDIPKVLEPFSQIESAMSRKNQGAGLGLPLVKRLVECHGGSLEIQSRLGEGTTVTVHFPKERLEKASSLRATGL